MLAFIATNERAREVFYAELGAAKDAYLALSGKAQLEIAIEATVIGGGIAVTKGKGRGGADNSLIIDDQATQSLKGKYARRIDVSYRDADDVNSAFPSGWEPPYKPGTRVTEFTTAVDDIYVRVHSETNKARAWMMKREAIDGLTPQQIQSKYALPEVPTFISEVHVPAGTRVRIGTVNPVFDGIGNATQYELLQKLPESVFKNTVRLGQ